MSENVQWPTSSSAILSAMDLDPAICHAALRTRDARFDGRFFTGVSSTGIYCRPICPARTPKAEHCTFFACAAAAEDAGYRACRRCRPETAPGTPAWQGTGATVARALRLIEEGALDGGGVPELADRLGVGDRHLRRLFAERLGASPLAVARTRRAHFARRLVEDTDLPMTRIAMASGYRDSRRFNADLRASFDRSPTEMRRLAGERPANGSLALRLAHRGALDWPSLTAYLGPRAIPGVEEVTGGVYRRAVVDDGFAGIVELSPDSKGGALLLRAPMAAAPELARLAVKARALCDLDADPAAIAEQLDEDERLRPALARVASPRVPGCWDRFELAVRAILGQQVSVAAATTLAGRLVARFGASLPFDDRLTHRFPTPAELADADLAAIGLTRARAETIRGLSRAVAGGEPLLELAPSLEEAVERLRALPGIGDWTAQYVALRALGEPDAFPAGDLGLRQAMADGERRPTEAALRRRAEAWRPWRGYAALLLWGELSNNLKEKR